MLIFRFYPTLKKFIAIVAVLFFVGTPFRADALGLSPPEVELGYIPVGSVQTVRAQISRAPNEMEGSVRITVTPRKSAAGFFFGESEFTLPEGTREVDYLFSIIPDYTQEAQQELYVTFLLQSSSSSSGSVSVVTGVTQVIRFTTDVSTSLPGAVSGGSSGGSGGVTQRDTDQDTQESTPSDSTDPQLDSAPESTLDVQIGQEEIPSSPEPETVILDEIEPQATDSHTQPSDNARSSAPLDDLSYESDEDVVPIQIDSPTHNIDEYSRNTQVMFSWLKPGRSKDTIFRFILNQNPTALAEELTYETKNPSIVFGLSDGVYYFHILDVARPLDGIQTRRVMIDATPPVVILRMETRPVFFLLPPRRAIVLETIDALSGVSDASATLDNVSVKIQNARIFTRGLGFGTHTLVVQATDFAGNIVDKTFAVDVVSKYPIAKVVSRIKVALVNSILSFFSR